MRLISKWFTPVLIGLVMGAWEPGISVQASERVNWKEDMENTSAFAFDLYDKLKEGKQNLFCSPFSISVALAMVYAGARGDTEGQMAQTLHFPLVQDRLHSAFSRLIAHLDTVQESGDVELNILNALWVQQDHVLLREYLDKVKKNYEVAPQQVDFKADPDAVRGQINAWVEQQTKNKISEMLQPGVIDVLTRLVLVNAIYFKGKWASQFQKENTGEAPFWISTTESIDVPMMRQTGQFKYAEHNDLQMLQLPYVGDTLSMIVLLPKKTDGLAELENALNPPSLQEWIGKLNRRKVLVLLPKWQITSQFSLKETLVNLGMPDAFGSSADFSGMDGTRDLYISAVIQKAAVDVGEEGTEATAATAVVQSRRSVSRPPLVFRADHPFVFVIRDNQSGSILFFGRVVNPKQQTDK